MINVLNIQTNMQSKANATFDKIESFLNLELENLYLYLYLPKLMV